MLTLLSLDHRSTEPPSPSPTASDVKSDERTGGPRKFTEKISDMFRKAKQMANSAMSGGREDDVPRSRSATPGSSRSARQQQAKSRVSRSSVSIASTFRPPSSMQGRVDDAGEFAEYDEGSRAEPFQSSRKERQKPLPRPDPRSARPASFRRGQPTQDPDSLFSSRPETRAESSRRATPRTSQNDLDSQESYRTGPSRSYIKTETSRTASTQRSQNDGGLDSQEPSQSGTWRSGTRTATSRGSRETSYLHSERTTRTDSTARNIASSTKATGGFSESNSQPSAVTSKKSARERMAQAQAQAQAQRQNPNPPPPVQPQQPQNPPRPPPHNQPRQPTFPPQPPTFNRPRSPSGLSTAPTIQVGETFSSVGSLHNSQKWTRPRPLSPTDGRSIAGARRQFAEEEARRAYLYSRHPARPPPRHPRARPNPRRQRAHDPHASASLEGGRDMRGIDEEDYDEDEGDDEDDRSTINIGR
jgi:hypothetical protein